MSYWAEVEVRNSIMGNWYGHEVGASSPAGAREQALSILRHDATRLKIASSGAVEFPSPRPHKSFLNCFRAKTYFACSPGKAGVLADVYLFRVWEQTKFVYNLR